MQTIIYGKTFFSRLFHTAPNVPHYSSKYENETTSPPAFGINCFYGLRVKGVSKKSNNLIGLIESSSCDEQHASLQYLIPMNNSYDFYSCGQERKKSIVKYLRN